MSSAHIPFEIQIEIIKRLPIKSLIRFRSVSKPWKSLIESSVFIADYHVHNSQSRRLLLSYKDQVDSQLKFVSIDDDDTFPQRKSSLTVPTFVKSIIAPRFLGSSHGLLGLYGCYKEPNLGYRLCNVAVIWNPSIRKSVVIEVPHEFPRIYESESVVGFGVCPKSNDPKLVKINFSRLRSECESMVEVFTLSSRAWRIASRNLPRKSTCFEFSHVVIDGFIYWMAVYSSSTSLDDGFVVYNLIVSFDLTNEEFGEIYLPEYLAQQSVDTLLISKLRDSLVVLNYFQNGVKLVYDVWMMEHGVPNSFTKLFTIDTPNPSLSMVLGFRKNGEPILKTVSVNLGVYGKVRSFFVSSYIETLVLLDQQDCSDYFNM